MPPGGWGEIVCFSEYQKNEQQTKLDKPGLKIQSYLQSCDQINEHYLKPIIYEIQKTFLNYLYDVVLTQNLKTTNSGKLYKIPIFAYQCELMMKKIYGEEIWMILKFIHQII